MRQIAQAELMSFSSSPSSDVCEVSVVSKGESGDGDDERSPNASFEPRQNGRNS